MLVECNVLIILAEYIFSWFYNYFPSSCVLVRFVVWALGSEWSEVLFTLWFSKNFLITCFIFHICKMGMIKVHRPLGGLLLPKLASFNWAIILNLQGFILAKVLLDCIFYHPILQIDNWNLKRIYNFSEDTSY